MDAHPVLVRVAKLLDKHTLEAILIGNAAAALLGAPVTTIDIDFLFRRTPSNIRKLKAIAGELDAVLLRPFYPVSPLWRIARDGDGLQIDFMNAIDGVRSFEECATRSTLTHIGGARVLIAALADIIRSKKAAGRPQDLAVLPALEKLREEDARHAESPTRSPEEGK
jgi:predicted nucleotidyltransferase